MLKSENASPEISETVKSKESGTDALIDADKVYNTWPASGIKLPDNVVGRTILANLQMETQGVLPDVS